MLRLFSPSTLFPYQSKEEKQLLVEGSFADLDNSEYMKTKVSFCLKFYLKKTEFPKYVFLVKFENPPYVHFIFCLTGVPLGVLYGTD